MSHIKKHLETIINLPWILDIKRKYSKNHSCQTARIKDINGTHTKIINIIIESFHSMAFVLISIFISNFYLILAFEALSHPQTNEVFIHFLVFRNIKILR